MAGREVFGQEEIKEVLDVLNRKVLFRYGFDKERAGVFKTAQFEKAFAGYAGSRYALGVGTGSAALKVALAALNLPKGKQVLAPCFTFVATIESIEEAGLIPVLCEADESLNMDPADVERKLTPDTVALMPVHMMGAAGRVDELTALVKAKNLKLVEDACQANGATYRGKKLGTFGDLGCYSFDYVKIMTTGEGGMVVTDSEELYHQADWYHDHGHPHLAGVPRGKETRSRNGFNYRMNEIQGALGLAQLAKLDAIIAGQKENKKTIKKEIQNISGLTMRRLPDEAGDTATFLAFFLPDAARTEVFKEKIAEKGVTAGTLNYWHFVANIESCGGAFPRTKALLDRCVALEMQTIMPESRLAQIVDAVKSAAKSVL